MNNFERTKGFLTACGKTPNEKDLSTQIGVHIEELSEFLECVDICDPWEYESLTSSIDSLRRIATRIKKNWCTASIPNRLRVAALDALCDSEVTGNGVAYLAGFNKVEADKRVLQSNDNKLVYGKPIILEGGKIGKPEGWTPPDLSNCV